MPSRSQKAAALAKFRDRKKARREYGVSGTNVDDLLEIKEEEDIYDIVDEKEYEELVESRRQREDFVVDDDGLGYYDDGEERLGDEGNEYDGDAGANSNNRKRSSNFASLTAAALKRARKTKQAAANNNTTTMADGDDKEDEENNSSSQKKNRSMWEFVQRGTPSVSAIRSHPNSSSSNSRNGSGGIGGAVGARTTNRSGKNVDDLLKELDDIAGPSSSLSRSRRKNTNNNGRARRSVYDSSSSSMRKRKTTLSFSSSQQQRSQRQQQKQRYAKQQHQPHRKSASIVEQDEPDDSGCFDQGGMDNDDDDVLDHDDAVNGKSDHIAEDHIHSEDKEQETPPAKVRFVDRFIETQEDDDIQKGRIVDENKTSKHNDQAEEQSSTPSIDEDQEEKPSVPRRTVAKPRFGQLSAPARKALEEQKEKEKQQQQRLQKNKNNSQTPVANQNTAMMKPSVCFSLDDIEPEVSASSMMGSSISSNNFESFIGTCTKENKAGSIEQTTYLDMFWMDIAEKNGDILLFGKVAAPTGQDTTNTVKQQQQPKKQFVSCCVLVKNNLRNLFVLPRKNTETGDYASMMDVHKEINTILRRDCIPHVEGSTWKGKPVNRHYAFGDSDIPREETQYLKVVYDAKYRTPSEQFCENGGKNFQKILGSKASVTENFIIKRKLMGPCWIRIYRPAPQTAPISWCKFEVQVQSPKEILRLDLVPEALPQEVPPASKAGSAIDGETNNEGEPQKTEANSSCDETSKTTTTTANTTSNNDNKNRPSPPVVTVSIKLKTIVNPKTHKSEIVSVSAICHKQVALDTAMDYQSIDSKRQMTQLSLIRPLPNYHLQEGGATCGVSNVATNALAQFPRDIDYVIAQSKIPQLRREPNERALLSRLLAQIGMWDPDIIVGHNVWGFEADMLLKRCVELKVQGWSKLGRRRRTKPPPASRSSNKDFVLLDVTCGRLICDVYLSAQEHLKETTYSLSHLASSQLKTIRQEIEPVDIPQWYQSSTTIVQLAMHTLCDAQFVQRLMFQLQVLPLSKQLTCIAGNIWSHTLKSNRAERTEYLLLHEFHRLKYLPPEKQYGSRKFNNSKQEDSKEGIQAGSAAPARQKAKYSGGLVLEPKKGLYDSFILLLDFNSLYPSIIQEYNLCFTTMDWSKYQNNGTKNNEETSEENPNNDGNALPPLPEECNSLGVLPRVIKTLVERRRAVKKMLKNEKDPDKYKELDIRQQALKLTANSMYGCLGFSNSRFFAQPIAAMVTSMGRETLQRTVNITQDTIGLDVIYGDTDSIMINTRMNEDKDLPKVKELGERVKREVNRLYKTLELEIDGIFRSLLLLKKKKYAAKTVTIIPNGNGDAPTIKYGQELKGLDLVRRDWCIQSKETGRYITDEILSGKDNEIVLNNICTYLEELAKKMRSNELSLEKYVITKGLSKHPNDYPDSKSQPHVQVAKRMLQNNRPVNTGDHIPYVITAEEEKNEETMDGNDGDNKEKNTKSSSFAERAFHPEEIVRSQGVLKPDVEWYLTQQILPPVARLCDPIEGISQSLLAQRLGLDSTKYNHHNGRSGDFNSNDGAEDGIGYTPASCLPDKERFQNVPKLMFLCKACHVKSEFPGVFHCVPRGDDNHKSTGTITEGLQCVNPDCPNPEFWGNDSYEECYCCIYNAMAYYVRDEVLNKYYQGIVQCDEPTCRLETRQLSVLGGYCLRRGCNGKMRSVYTERTVHTQLKYLETLFDVDHACEQIYKNQNMNQNDTLATKNKQKDEIKKKLSKDAEITFKELHESSKRYLGANAFNWISPSFWKSLLGSTATGSAITFGVQKQ